MAGDDVHHPKDALKAGFTGLTIVGTSGFFVAAIHNALQVNNVGAMSVFTRSGGIIGIFGTTSPIGCSIVEETLLTCVLRI